MPHGKINPIESEAHMDIPMFVSQFTGSLVFTHDSIASGIECARGLVKPSDFIT